MNPVDWDDHQDPSLEAVTRAVDLHTESWYNERLRKLQRQRIPLTYERQAESVGERNEGSRRQHEMDRNGKKKVLEVEKGKEHLEPQAKRQHAAPSRESIIEARGQEVNSSDKGVVVEVSSDSKSSGYRERAPSTPLSWRTHKEMIWQKLVENKMG